MKRILVLLAIVLAAASCSRTERVEKYCWICTDANFARLSSKDSVDFYLDKIKATGFNHVVVDVKGVDARVMYKSAIYPELTEVNGFVCERDWDYLGYFVKQAHRRGLKVTASMSIFPVGSLYPRRGPVFEDESLKRLTCVMQTPDGMCKIEDVHDGQVAAFMNPALPESRQIALKALREVLEGYDIDGLALDYCRYPGEMADFSPASKVLFEQYLGTEIDNWPSDVWTWGPDGQKIRGQYYKQWWTWRSGVIKDFVASVRALIDEVKPGVKLSYWAASWLDSIYQNGQNWASDESRFYEPYLDDWAEKDYCKTGFAGLLDVFITGAYLERVWGMDDPVSIEYAMWRSNRDVAGACTMVGSIYAQNTVDEFEDATYVALRDSDGLMVFDLVQIVGYDLWDEIAAGIKRTGK